MFHLVKSSYRKISFIVKRFLVLKGIITKFSPCIAGKRVVFHDLYRSSLLKQIALNGIYSYEPELNLFIRKYPFPIKTFIDAGANIGYYSIIADCIFGSTIHVLAVEPFHENISYLQDIKTKNDLTFEILPFAMSFATGKEVELFFPTGKSSSQLASSASLINSFSGTGGLYDHLDYSVVRVKTISLRDILETAVPPYLIKLDCEGHELSILTAVKEYLRSHDDMDFVVEIMINDQDKRDIFDLMIECGYKGFLITNGGLVREDRPLTLPYFDSQRRPARTCWKNHYFTKKSQKQIEDMSIEIFGYYI